MQPDLQAAIVAFARQLPRDQVEQAAALIETASVPKEVTGKLSSLVANNRFQKIAGDLAAAWIASPGISGSALAMALGAAAGATEAERQRQQMELVWTGPSEVGIPIRQTESVLIELINAAEHRLTLVSFVAYKTKTVSDALQGASDRGVDVRLVLDGGSNAQLAFASLGDVVRLYTWPPTLLPDHDPGHASLHAKTAIADTKVAFVTSANLTGKAMSSNMELGLLVTGGEVPKRLADHFNALIDSDVLVPWTTALPPGL